MKDIHIYIPQIANRIIGSSEYKMVSILSFFAKDTASIADTIRKTSIPFKWDGNFLKGISGMDAVVEKMFNTKEIGIVYFVNDEEPTLPINEMKPNIGDRIELAYIEKNWQK